MTNARILIVEKPATAAQDLESTLRELGYEVCGIASSGEDAIRQAGDGGPDLVLMDVVLQGKMPGTEAAEKIRSQHAVPVVYVTARVDVEILEKPQQAEPYGFVVKPYTPQSLGAAIDVTLYKHQMDRRANHALMRDGLRELITQQGDMQVVAEAGDGRMTLAMVADFSPDVAILDIGMPDLNGIDATTQIQRDHPDTRVIALSAHSDKRFVTGMLRAGASGCLLKDSAFDELALAIRAVAAGKTYLSASIAGVVLDDYRDLARKTNNPPPVRPQRTRTGSAATPRGRQSDPGNCRSAERQHKDRRDPPQAPHGETEPPHHRRTDQVRPTRRTDGDRRIRENGCPEWLWGGVTGAGCRCSMLRRISAQHWERLSSRGEGFLQRPTRRSRRRCRNR